MRPDVRALVFDLDDTLYPYRAFVESGFRVVARRLADDYGFATSRVLDLLRDASRNGARGRELQALCDELSLPPSLVPELAEVMRRHVPSLRLPVESHRALQATRRGWKLAILTNGRPDIQRRKVAALGLGALVDAVVFAAECGDGIGKPAADAFHAVLNRVGAAPHMSVFVGNDPRADMAGAAAVGMHTMHLTGHQPVGLACDGRWCGVHVERIGQVPAIASWLVPERMARHAG